MGFFFKNWKGKRIRIELGFKLKDGFVNGNIGRDKEGERKEGFSEMSVLRYFNEIVSEFDLFFVIVCLSSFFY